MGQPTNNSESPTLESIQDDLRRIARALANLTSHQAEALRASQHREDLAIDLLLALVTEKRYERTNDQRPRRDSGDITDKFTLPVGIGHVELTRRAQRRFIMWVVGIAAAVGSAVVHALLRFIH